MDKTKALIVIGGGLLSYKTFEECNNLGIETILVDGNSECFCHRCASYFIQASTKEPDIVLPQVKKFISSHRKDMDILGVYTQGCDCNYATLLEHQ